MTLAWRHRRHPRHRSAQPCPHGPQRAFTLVEVLLVLVLVALLATLALPSYHDLLRRSHRGLARTGLVHAAHALERQATATGAYPDGELPESLARLAAPHYRLRRGPEDDAQAAALHFLLVAEPQGDQARDRCGTFTLDSNGERGVRDAQATREACWPQ